MAELEAGKPVPFSTQDISARVQLLAVAWLRWRIFVNSMFRRRGTGKRQAAGLALAILVRIVVWPFLALMVARGIGLPLSSKSLPLMVWVCASAKKPASRRAKAIPAYLLI